MTSLYRPRTGQVATPETGVGETYYDYSRIDDPQARQVARQVAEQIRPILRRTAVNAWTVGNMANQVKAVLPHGQFVEWAEAEFGSEQPGVQLSVRSLQRWMGLAATVPLALVETSGMSLAGLLEASAPSTPPEVRAQALAEAEAGVPPSKARVQAMKQEVENDGLGSQAGKPAKSDLITITLAEPLAWILLAFLQGDTELKHYDRETIIRLLLDVLAEDDDE